MKYIRFQQKSPPYAWPRPPFQVALVEPEIPPNTGNIARLCAATGTPLHLIGKLGFRISDADVRRAGLDYWDSVDLHLHENFDLFQSSLQPSRFFLFSVHGQKWYTSAQYRPGDVLVFGCETRGLPQELLNAHPGNVLAIPIQTDHVRSLNLATSVGIVLYEAIRQVSGLDDPQAGVAESADAQDLKS